MTWLLWKDYRHNRPIVVFWLLFLLAPYAIACCVIGYGLVHHVAISSIDLWHAAVAASAYSVALAQVALALLGGNAFAGERVDRSGEFLASLPLTKTRILIGKLFLTAIIGGASWLFNATVLISFMTCLGFVTLPEGPETPTFVTNTALTGMVFFCVAWFLSSFLSSPTFSVGGGLVAPLMVIGTLSYIAYLFGIAQTGAMAQFWYSTICLTLAPLCFVLGTGYYLRRVEP